MAGTIKLTTGITHTNGSLSIPVASKTKEITQTTQCVYQNVQIIGTSAEALTTGDIASLGIAMLENLDAANFVDVGPDDSGTMKDFLRIKAGERFPVRLKPGITVKAKADTAPVRLLVTLYDD